MKPNNSKQKEPTTTFEKKKVEPKEKRPPNPEKREGGGKKLRKARANLARRIAWFESMSGKRGYTRPGSLKK